MKPLKCMSCPWGVTGKCRSLYVPDKTRFGAVVVNPMYNATVSYEPHCAHWQTGFQHLHDAYTRVIGDYPVRGPK